MKTYPRIAVLAGLLLTTAAVSIAHADDELDLTTSDAPAVSATTEGYFGLLLPYQKPGGDLDGKRIYSNTDGVALVPKLKGAVGLGLVLGLKHNGAGGRGFALEGSVQGSGHKSHMNGGPEMDAAIGLVSGDFKFFPTTGGPVEPYLQAGLCVASLNVKDGFLKAGGGSKEETFNGSGLNLGAGVMTYLSPRFAVHLAAIYRFIEYNQLDYGTRARLGERLTGNILSVEFGMTFRFARH